MLHHQVDEHGLTQTIGMWESVNVFSTSLCYISSGSAHRQGWYMQSDECNSLGSVFNVAVVLSQQHCDLLQ
jgi:hypothetical protein